MARSAFGGSGDYSSLFGSLYAQSKAQKQQQQDALDKDAYDRWKNGLSSDSEWINYIQGRVDATASDKDPTDHQHWIQLQRQYVTSIADSQAEYSFSEGKSTIGQLIAYYQDRLGRLQESSDEYRQLKGHLDDLIDKRDSEDLSTGAQAISSKIDNGKASYEDLLKFYRDRLGGLRPGSDLYKQVSDEITKVKDTIADSKMAGDFEKLKYMYEAGKLSGGNYAAKLRSMAAPFKASDPQKYYQILEAANRVARTGGGSGGGSGGGGGGSGFSKSERTLEQRLKGIDQYLQSFSDAYRSGARVIPDQMHPGQQIVLSPELIAEVDQQRLSNYDKLAHLYKSNNDAYHYRNTLQDKTNYIVRFVQPHNTVDASHQWGQLVGAAQKQITSLADNADLEGSLQSVVKSFQGMQEWLKGEVVKNGKIVNAENQPTGNFLENTSGYVDQALQILTDPEMDSKARMEALAGLTGSLASDTGSDYDKGTKAAMTSLLQQAGAISSGAFDLASGKKVPIIDANGEFGVADVRVQHTLATDPATGQMVNTDLAAPSIELANGQRIQEVWVDRGGQPTKVYAVVDKAPSGYQVWYATRAVKIGGQTYKQGVAIRSSALSASNWDAIVQSGAVQKGDAAKAGLQLNYIQVPAYDDGGQHHAAITWYQDPQTHLWYKGQPPISSATLNTDGTLSIGDDGKLQINWRPFSHLGGEVSPYAGSNAKAMQDLYDQGAVGTDPRYNQSTGGMRDYAGNFTTDPTKAPNGGPMYFDPKAERFAADDRADSDGYAQQQKIDALRKQLESATTNHPGNDENFVAFVQKQAQALGINMGDLTQPAKPPVSTFVPSPSPDVMDARRAAQQRSAATPRIGLPAGKAADDVAFPLPNAAYTSSGPALADLPGASAGKIDPNKIVAQPAPKHSRDAGAPAPAPLPTPTRKLAGAPTTVVVKHGGQQEFN